MKTIAIAAVLLSTAALAQTCDYYPLTTCAQNLLGTKTFYDGIVTDGGVTINGSLTVTGDAGFSRSTIWSTPDITENVSGSNTRPLQGGLSGVNGTIGSVVCQPAERGDGGGDVYLSLLDVTDGGVGNLLCSIDFDKCDLTANLSGVLGIALETGGACNGQALSATKRYLWRMGVNIDGGATCGLHTPVMMCNTVITAP